MKLLSEEWASGAYLVESIDGNGCKNLARFVKQ